MRFPRNQEIDCGFRNHLGFAIWFSKTEPDSTATGLLLASATDSADAVSFAGAEAFISTRHPLSSFRFAVASRTTRPPTPAAPCAASRFEPVLFSEGRGFYNFPHLFVNHPLEPLLPVRSRLLLRPGVDHLVRARRSFEGARLLQPSAPCCQPPFRTLASGSKPLAAATWGRPPRPSSSLFRRGAASTTCRSTLSTTRLRGRLPSTELLLLSAGARLLRSAASFVNQDSFRKLLRESWPRISNLQRRTNRAERNLRAGLFNCMWSLADSLIRSPFGTAPAQHLPARQVCPANAAGNTHRGVRCQPFAL